MYFLQNTEDVRIRAKEWTGVMKVQVNSSISIWQHQRTESGLWYGYWQLMTKEKWKLKKVDWCYLSTWSSEFVTKEPPTQETNLNSRMNIYRSCGPEKIGTGDQTLVKSRRESAWVSKWEAKLGWALFVGSKVPACF